MSEVLARKNFDKDIQDTCELLADESPSAPSSAPSEGIAAAVIRTCDKTSSKPSDEPFRNRRRRRLSSHRRSRQLDSKRQAIIGAIFDAFLMTIFVVVSAAITLSPQSSSCNHRVPLLLYPSTFTGAESNQSVAVQVTGLLFDWIVW
jgi:hypothetical protein